MISSGFPVAEWPHARYFPWPGLNRLQHRSPGSTGERYFFIHIPSSSLLHELDIPNKNILKMDGAVSLTCYPFPTAAVKNNPIFLFFFPKAVL